MRGNTCYKFTRYSESLYIKMHVIDPHIDAHTYVILLMHIFIIIGIPNSA